MGEFIVFLIFCALGAFFIRLFFWGLHKFFAKTKGKIAIVIKDENGNATPIGTIIYGADIEDPKLFRGFKSLKAAISFIFQKAVRLFIYLKAVKSFISRKSTKISKFIESFINELYFGNSRQPSYQDLTKKVRKEE